MRDALRNPDKGVAKLLGLVTGAGLIGSNATSRSLASSVASVGASAATASEQRLSRC